MEGGETECGQLSSQVWQGRQEQDGRSWGLDQGHVKILTEDGDGVTELPEGRQQRDREQGSVWTVAESPGRHRGPGQRGWAAGGGELKLADPGAETAGSPGT